MNNLNVSVDVTDAQSNILGIAIHTVPRSLNAISQQDHGILIMARGWCPVLKKYFIRRIALLVEALHARGVIHGSISPSCITYCSNMDILHLRNAGIYQAAQRFTPLRLLPELSRYAPREVLNSDTFTQSKEADVYSWACVAYALFIGNAIFSGRRPSQCVCIISTDGHSSLQQPSNMPDDVWAILRSCWDAPADQRPTMATIVGLLSLP